MSMLIQLKDREKSKFTRKCIGDAIIDLLKNVDFESLKISNIVSRAGVSRMTFYSHYKSINDALDDYLQMIISEYLKAINNEEDRSKYLTYDHILFALNFFDEYRLFFLTMHKCNKYSLLIRSVNDFMEKYMIPNKKITIYEMYAYAGGLLNTFMIWEVSGKKESAEEIANEIYNLYGKINK